MKNLDEKIEKNLIKLDEILKITNPINIPFDTKDSFLYDVQKIVDSGLNEKVYNYSVNLLHAIYKKRTKEHMLWLDEFELSVRTILKYY